MVTSHIHNYHTPLKRFVDTHIMSDAPIFPDFKKLELSDRPLIEQYVRQFPPYSDFNFISLWSYNVKDEAEICFLNDNLVIKFHDYITGEPFYTFLGENEVKDTIKTLISFAKKENVSSTLKLIPESVVKKLENVEHAFEVVEDHDSHDYVYSIPEMAALAGNRFRGKRNFVNRFKQNSEDAQLQIVDIKNKAVQEKFIQLFYDWEKRKQADRSDTETELAAIKRLFNLNSLENINALAIFKKEKIVGFSIFEIVQNNYAILHFLKADTSYVGIYPYLFQERAKLLQSKGINFLNAEQDLGIENLRKSKRSWLPVHYFKKYTISDKK